MTHICGCVHTDRSLYIMCVFIPTDVCIYIHMHKSVHVYMRLHGRVYCMYIYIYIYIYILGERDMYVYMCINMHIYIIYVYTYICVCVCVCVYILPSTDCFVVSQLFNVARHTRFTNLGLKPGWLLHQPEILPLRHTHIYHHHHHHHVVPLARISLTLSHHFSLSFIASGRSSGLHPYPHIAAICMFELVVLLLLAICGGP